MAEAGDPPLTEKQRAYLDSFDRYLMSVTVEGEVEARLDMRDKLQSVLDEKGVVPGAIQRPQRTPLWAA